MKTSSKLRKGRRSCSEQYLNCWLTDTIFIEDVINSGSFGEIYLGVCRSTGKKYAVKFEKIREDKRNKGLFQEQEIMDRLTSTVLLPTSRLLTPVDNYLRREVLIMELLGPNMGQLLRLCDKRIPIDTILPIMQKMVRRLQEIHACGYLHKDVKPDNFCLGGPELKELYLIDFGLSRPYRDPQGNHILEPAKGFVGTPRYASRNCHSHKYLSRIDDLEAVGYVCLYLLHGSLPWQNIKTKDKSHKHKMLFKAKSKFIDTLIEDDIDTVPSAIRLFLIEVSKLHVFDDPDYDKLVSVLGGSDRIMNLKCDFAWETDPEFQQARLEFNGGTRAKEVLNSKPQVNSYYYPGGKAN